MTINSQTLDAWEAETRDYIAPDHPEHELFLNNDIMAERILALISAFRSLQEREAAFRDSLNSIKRAASEEQPTLRDKFYFDLADEVLARYPGGES